MSFLWMVTLFGPTNSSGMTILETVLIGTEGTRTEGADIENTSVKGPCTKGTCFNRTCKWAGTCSSGAYKGCWYYSRWCSRCSYQGY